MIFFAPLELETQKNLNLLDLCIQYSSINFFLKMTLYLWNIINKQQMGRKNPKQQELSITFKFYVSKQSLYLILRFKNIFLKN